jgi:lipopolysaccharide export system protein LptA
MTEAKESITYNRASGVITNIGDTATRFTDGRQIFGDQAVTTIDAENGGINTITVTGNARILHPDQNGTIQEATGDHAFYDAAADTVTVTGNVILTEADNILKGSKAVMKIGEGTSVLSADGNTNRVSGQFILE